jgi:hypothetical protein
MLRLVHASQSLYIDNETVGYVITELEATIVSIFLVIYIHLLYISFASYEMLTMLLYYLKYFLLYSRQSSAWMSTV